MATAVDELARDLESARHHVDVARRNAQRRVHSAGLLVTLLLVALAAAVIGLLSRGEEDPMLRMLREAPIDDEPLSDAERRAIDEALAGVRRGETVPFPEDESGPAVA